MRILPPITALALVALVTAAADAQQAKPASPAAATKPAAAKAGPADSKLGAQAAKDGAASAKGWVAPGTPGSPIKGDLFHAQVLLDVAGFSPGAIDGKDGSSFKLALNGFQEANGLPKTGKLDGPTRAALIKVGRASTVMVKLGPDDVNSNYVYPLPKDPEEQYKLKFLGYRNMLEK
ncbi:MAG: peptidoglycan-binding domain-containing protein, partial [Sphingomicrobium sp.]